MSEEQNLIATIPRGATEQLQIAINSYKGKQYLDLRIFYTTDEGASWSPTKKGVTVAPESLELLKECVEKAIAELVPGE